MFVIFFILFKLIIWYCDWTSYIRQLLLEQTSFLGYMAKFSGTHWKLSCMNNEH